MAKGSSRKLRKRLASANAVATAVIDEQARAAASSNLSNDDLFFVERGGASAHSRESAVYEPLPRAALMITRTVRPP